MTELKPLLPCPHCKGDVMELIRDYEESIIECQKCNAVWEIAKLWNTRAPDLAMQKREEVSVKDNKELINKLLIAEIALEYYADKDSYDDNNAPYSHLPEKPWIPIADCGKVAIAALKSIKE